MAPVGPTLPATSAVIVLLDIDGQDEWLTTPVPPADGVLVATCTPVETVAGLTPVLAEPPQAACAAPDAPSATANASEARKAPLEITGSLEVEVNLFPLPLGADAPRQKSFRMMVLHAQL